MLLEAEKSHLVVIDEQERLLPAMTDPKLVTKNTGILLQSANLLSIPVTISRQYPQGLGDTVEQVARHAGDAKVFDKLSFACSQDAGIRAHADDLRRAGRDQLVLCGMEMHICVLQTAIGFQDAGWRVAVVVDASASRTHESKDIALRRMAMTGVSLVTTEMAVFEWAREAGSEAFRALHKLIK